VRHRPLVALLFWQCVMGFCVAAAAAAGYLFFDLRRFGDHLGMAIEAACVVVGLLVANAARIEARDAASRLDR
jgi:hypothetical protein